jgi:hypothetical protein
MRIQNVINSKIKQILWLGTRPETRWLRHYATCHGFDSLWSHWMFKYSQPHYSPGVDSASNTNEYHKSSWGVKSGRRVRLKTSPPSISQLSRNFEASTSLNSMGLHALLQGYRYLFTLPEAESRNNSLEENRSWETESRPYAQEISNLLLKSKCSVRPYIGSCPEVAGSSTWCSMLFI